MDERVCENPKPSWANNTTRPFSRNRRIVVAVERVKDRVPHIRRGLLKGRTTNHNLSRKGRSHPTLPASPVAQRRSSQHNDKRFDHKAAICWASALPGKRERRKVLSYHQRKVQAFEQCVTLRRISIRNSKMERSYSRMRELVTSTSDHFQVTITVEAREKWWWCPSEKSIEEDGSHAAWRRAWPWQNGSIGLKFVQVQVLLRLDGF